MSTSYVLSLTGRQGHNENQEFYMIIQIKSNISESTYCHEKVKIKCRLVRRLDGTFPFHRESGKGIKEVMIIFKKSDIKRKKYNNSLRISAE